MKLVALLALSVAGCAASTEPVEISPVLAEGTPAAPASMKSAVLEWRVVLDPALPPSRVLAVRSALADWQAAVPCAITFVVVSGRTRGFEEWPLPAAGTIEVFETTDIPGPAGYARWYGTSGSRVAWLPAVGDENLARTLRHEFGHAFHLPHADGQVSIMSTTDPGSSTIRPVDAAAFGAIWCPGSEKS